VVAFDKTTIGMDISYAFVINVIDCFGDEDASSRRQVTIFSFVELGTIVVGLHRK